MRPMIFPLIVMLGLPATAVGQNVSGGAIGSIGASTDTVPNWFIRPLIGPTSAGYPPRDPLPSFAIPPLIGQPSIGLPLPPIGTPLPPIGLQPSFDGNRHTRHHWRQPVVFWPIFMVPQAAYVMTAPAAPEPAPSKKESATGHLVLYVEPGTAQVFIDGYYAGTPDDFSRRGEPALETGPHTVDIHAAGYESVSFDVRISPNQSIVYRRVLKTVEPTPPPAIHDGPAKAGHYVQSTTPTTFYLIPGCYMGSVPPKDAGLPSTCDITRAVTFTPK